MGGSTTVVADIRANACVLRFGLFIYLYCAFSSSVAPEVSLSEPYSLTADIYSFSVLFWELLSLEKAFGELSSEEHKERVIKGHDRLPFDQEWPLPVTYLLGASWDPDPFKRPSARDVCKALRQELSMCYDSLRANSGAQERRPSY